nr:rod shape-determining protein MreC [Rhabdothermincola salaria]
MLVLTSITLLTLDFRGFAPLERARSAVLSVLSPVGDVAANVFDPIGDWWDSAFNSDEILAENEALRTRVDELEGELTSAQVAKDSLEELLTLVGIPFVGDIPTVPARVVSGAIGNFDTTMELDKGSSDGIAEGMPVVTGRGLIGRVVNVSSDRSRVELLTGGNLRVGFRTVGTNIIGTVSGTGRAGQLTGSVSQDRPVEVGDILVTSGLELSPYPAGLPVGTITGITEDDAARVKRLDVTMLADVSDLTFASVVLYEAPQ